MWEAIASTEIEPGQTIKFGGGDLEYEVLNVTRAPITNTVTSLITRRSSDGYTYQAVDFVTQCFQVWRKYAAPVTSDEGLVVESSTPDAPSPLLDTLRDELKARIQNVSDTVLLEAHQRGNGFAGLLAQIGEKLTESLELKHLRHAQQDAVKVELTRGEATDRLLTHANDKAKEERTRKAIAEAFLGKNISNNGRLVGTIVEASFTDDGLQVIAHKPTTPLGFDFNTTRLLGEPQLSIPPSLRPRPAFVNPGVSIHRDGGISVDGRGPLTGVFGQDDGALFWQKLGNPIDEKPEPTFTLAQLKSAVKKARKRARRSALREMYGFIRNNLKLRAAEYGRIAVRFGMEDRS